LECETFAEYGHGIGSDGVALAMQGLRPVWLCDANRKNRAIVREMFKRLTEFSPDIFSPFGENMAERVKPDLLYSSDVFEHIFDLEGFLEPWIGGFRVVIVYAPFGSNDVQHQHTSYPAARFHRFMESMGYQKIVFNLAVPPFVYIGEQVPRRILLKLMGG
jgi:hypothetical protein